MDNVFLFTHPSVSNNPLSLVHLSLLLRIPTFRVLITNPKFPLDIFSRMRLWVLFQRVVLLTLLFVHSD